MKLRFISLFIATAAIISACCGVFYAQNQEKEVISSHSISAESEFVFSLETAKNSLRLCSLAGYPENLNAVLTNEGYEDIEYFQYENSIKSDNKAGLVLCRKKSLLMAIIRGTKDEEWYSNFYIGEGVQHAGFSKAAELAIQNVNNYMSRHSLNKSDTEIFVTGHSRGAAVSNLVSAQLIDENKFKSVCAYNFACPNTTMIESAEDEKYKSIINILNPQDFICYIPLPQWGYKRYGKTIELPDYDTINFEILYEEMKKSYLAETCSELRDFPQKGKDVENIINYLYLIAPTPEDYYQKEITVGSYRLTMYDYMMKLAAVMSGENPLLHGLFMLSCKSIPEVSAITEFVFSGLTEKELKTTTSLDKTPVVVNHMHDAYMAWFNVLNEEYFYERLK